MDNRLHISFYINTQRASNDKYPIYMRITVAGKREAVNTGLTVSKQNWDSTKSIIKLWVLDPAKSLTYTR